MKENVNPENKIEIILENNKNSEYYIFDKLCNIQKLLKKESSLKKLCKKN